MTAAVTPGRELLEGLIQDAISVLHHDTTDGSDVDKYERECLRKKFSARLAAKPAGQTVEPEELENLISDRSANRAADLIITNYNVTRRSTTGEPKRTREGVCSACGGHGVVRVPVAGGPHMSISERESHDNEVDE